MSSSGFLDKLKKQAMDKLRKPDGDSATIKVEESDSAVDPNTKPEKKRPSEGNGKAEKAALGASKPAKKVKADPGTTKPPPKPKGNAKAAGKQPAKPSQKKTAPNSSSTQLPSAKSGERAVKKEVKETKGADGQLVRVQLAKKPAKRKLMPGVKETALTKSRNSFKNRRKTSSKSLVHMYKTAARYFPSKNRTGQPITRTLKLLPNSAFTAAIALAAKEIAEEQREQNLALGQHVDEEEEASPWQPTILKDAGVAITLELARYAQSAAFNASICSGFYDRYDALTDKDKEDLRSANGTESNQAKIPFPRMNASNMKRGFDRVDNEYNLA